MNILLSLALACVMQVIFLSNISANELLVEEAHFQYQVEIELNETESIQKIELPETVHALLQNKDATDLQVFDSTGRMIPTHIEFIGAPEADELSVLLHHFPVSILKNALKSDSDSLQFNYKDGKIEVLVDSITLENELQTIGFIFENPLRKEQIPETLDGKDFRELIIKTHENFEGSASLVLKSSDDLNAWNTLSTSEKIVNISFMDQKLLKDRISIPANAERFIMLTWEGSLKPEIQSVSGVFKEKSTLPPYQWAKISKLKHLEDDQKTNAYTFELSPAFRSTLFRIQNIKNNEIYSGTLQSKLGDKENVWSTVTPFSFYKVPNGADYLEATQSKVPANYKNLWRIHFDYPLEKIDMDKLVIEFNRHPINLYYLPSGTPPYHLKLGRKAASEQPIKLAETIQALIKDKNTKLSESSLKINSLKKSEISSSLKINWKQFILWATLIAGVAVMAWMAKDTLKSMKRD